MIRKLQNNDPITAEEIRLVFQKSYTVEAKLLNANDFPPLKRKLEEYINSKNQFFGFFKENRLAAVVEIKLDSDFTHIQSFVVHPDFFRLGIGRTLMFFIIEKFDQKPLFVETGVKNIPAIELYKKCGFIETNQWDTEYGIRKIRLDKR